jgi:uncharacterized membrane protein YbaN (DUF454 family)
MLQRGAHIGKYKNKQEHHSRCRSSRTRETVRDMSVHCRQQHVRTCRVTVYAAQDRVAPSVTRHGPVRVYSSNDYRSMCRGVFDRMLPCVPLFFRFLFSFDSSSKSFINTMYVKCLLFQSKTQYHAGRHARRSRKYGLEVARLIVTLFTFLSLHEIRQLDIELFVCVCVCLLQRAKQLIDQAVRQSTIAPLTTILRSNQDEITRAAGSAQKDNDLIYNDVVPDATLLPSIQAQPIAKASPVQCPLSSDFQGKTNTETFTS